VKSSKVCRTTLIRILVTVALISSLLTLPAFSQDTEDSQVFISGFNAYQQQNYSTAIERMDEVLRKYPNSPLRDMALFWLARAHFKSGHRQEAARTMSQFAHEYPDNPLKGTVEEELLALAEAYDKGEKIATAPPATASAGKPAAASAMQEQERAAAEKARLEAGRKEQERVAAEKAEKARAEAEAAEKARLAAVKAEQERAAVAEKARLEAARKEQERIAAEKAAAQAEAARLAAAQKQQERIAAEKAAKVRAEAEAAEKARLAAVKAEKERAVAAEQARLEAARKEQERIAAEKAAAQAETARLAAAAKKEQERIATEKAAKVRAEAEAAEKTRLAALKAEKERAAAAEKARLETARKEQERIAAIRAEELRLTKQREADEKALATKSMLREKAIAQYRSVIQTYPNTKSAAVAAARLKELGITVAQPLQPATVRQPVESGDNAQVLQLEVAQFAGFEFRLLATPAAYDAGRAVSLPFEVTNRGNGTDSFRLESGFPVEFQAGFAAAEKPDRAIAQTPPLAPNETFKGVVTLTIPAASIDGMRYSHPIKASSGFMPEATQSREIQVSAAAPFLRAVLKTDQTRPLPGDKITYRIVVLNVGSTTARDVTVRLSYPPQLEPLDRGTSGFTTDAKPFLLLEGLQVKSGERKEFTVAFQLKDDSLAGQDLAVRAELTEVPLKKSSAFISNLSSVDARHGIKVRPGSEKLVIIPGETANIPFTVTNTGNTRDTFKIVPTVTGAGTSTLYHDLNRDGIRQANEPAITEIGPLEPKEEAAVGIEIRTSRDTADGSEGGVRLDFSPKGSATALAAGSARLIYSRPVLQLAMSKSDGRLKPGEIASYDLTVVNRGSNLARVVELQSSWPEQLELVAAEPSNSSAAAGTIHWKFKELGAGEKRSIKVSFRVKAGIGAGTSIQVRNSLNYEDLQGNRY